MYKMPLQEKQFDNQLPSEYLKKISESQEGKSKFKRFVQAGLNHISVTADADGTFDPGKINLYKSGTNGSIELENGKIISLPQSWLLDFSEVQNKVGVYKIYLDQRNYDSTTLSLMKLDEKTDRPYVTLHVLSKDVPQESTEFYMKNRYPDTYATMEELPEEIKNFDFSYVRSVGAFFAGCAALKEIPDLKNLDNVQGAGMMFQGCKSLTKIGKFSLKNCSNLSRMFEGCSSLEEIDMDFINARVYPNSGMLINTSSMFKDCSSLKKVSINADTFGDVSKMFTGCSAIENVFLYNCDKSKNWTPALVGLANESAFHYLALE